MLVLGYGILWTTEDEETMERHARPLLADLNPVEQEISVVVDEEPIANEPEEKTVEETPSADGGDKDTDEQSESEEESIPQEEAKGEEDKYNLHEYGSASEDEFPVSVSSNPVSQSTQPKKQFLSAKQRRDLKKGKPVSTTNTTTAHSDSDSDTDIETAISSIDALSVSSKTKPQQPKVRGKKGKLKKLKTKYAEQSDEEKELAKKLLGAKGTPIKPAPKTEKVETKPILPKKPQPAPRPPEPVNPVIDEPLEVPPNRPSDMYINIVGSRSLIKRSHLRTKTKRRHIRRRPGLCSVVRPHTLQIQSQTHARNNKKGESGPFNRRGIPIYTPRRNRGRRRENESEGEGIVDEFEGYVPPRFR